MPAMPIMYSPLTLKELKEVDDFLIKTSKVGNPRNLTTLHGYFCAILSAPHSIAPSIWEPPLFAGAPLFLGLEEAYRISSYILRFRESTLKQLRGEEELEILLWCGNKKISLTSASTDVIADWCLGFILGASLDKEWTDEPHSKSFLITLAVLANQCDIRGQPDENGNPIVDDAPYRKKYIDNLVNNVKRTYELYSPFQLELDPIVGKTKTYRVNFEEVEADKLCTCGSGKAYEDCCNSESQKVH
ncbi:MAG: UPF0149 family protein [Proteobacteria bacterium]|nr:UPF0149 family protein [Pseudomonadota bacterium]